MEIKRKVFFIGLALFFFAFSLRVWNLNVTGRTWDEHNYAIYGFDMTEHIRKGDLSSNYWLIPTSITAPPLARYIYGFFAHFDVEKNIEGKTYFNYDLTYSRLASVFASSVSVLVIYLIGIRYLSQTAALASAIIFATLPFFLGLSQIVSLESLIMLFFTLDIYVFLRFLENQKKALLFWSGIFLGFALSVKLTNVLLVPIILIISFIWLKKIKDKKLLKRLIIQIFLIMLIGLLTYAVLWPMPLFHIKEFIQLTAKERLANEGCLPEIFFGRLMCAPIIWYPILFLVTTPLLVLFLFLKGIIDIDKILNRGWTKRQNFFYVVLLVWFVIPFFQSFYPHRQHGIRYIIEIYAPMSLIAGLGFQTFLKKFNKNNLLKISILLFFFSYLMIVLLKSSPYYLYYFNEAVGGINNVYQKKLFLLGWWGDGLRDASLYLQNHAPKNSFVGLALDPTIHTMRLVDGLNFSIFQYAKTYDYVVVNYHNVIRTGFNEANLYKNYYIVYTVYQNKAELVHVLKRK